MLVTDASRAGAGRPVDDAPDPRYATDRFRTIATAACAGLRDLGSQTGEPAQAAVVIASRAVGFLEALMLVAPDVAHAVASDAERLEAALESASSRLGPRFVNRC
jgi:hypothetical protein